MHFATPLLLFLLRLRVEIDGRFWTISLSVSHLVQLILTPPIAVMIHVGYVMPSARLSSVCLNVLSISPVSIYIYLKYHMFKLHQISGARLLSISGFMDDVSLAHGPATGHVKKVNRISSLNVILFETIIVHAHAGLSAPSGPLIVRYIRQCCASIDCEAYERSDCS